MMLVWRLLIAGGKRVHGSANRREIILFGKLKGEEAVLISRATLVNKGPHHNRPQGPGDQGNISLSPRKKSVNFLISSVYLNK